MSSVFCAKEMWIIKPVQIFLLHCIICHFNKIHQNVIKCCLPNIKKTANRQSARTEVLIWYCWVITKCGIVVGQSPSTVLLLSNQQVVRQITNKVLLDNKVKAKIYLGIDTNYIQV